MTRRREGGAEAVVVIDRVGARGDGIARHAGSSVYVPFAAPGDRVRIRLGERRGDGRAAELVEVLAPGERATPPCPHFGICGGCALQHLSHEAYARTKETQIAAALGQHGLAVGQMAPLLRIPPGTRRRARLAVHMPRAPAAPPVIGFNARASHRVADMQACAVLHPALLALIEPLRGIASVLWPPGSSAAASATLSDTGVDLLLDLAAPPPLAALEALAAFAERQNLARLSWRTPNTDGVTPVAIRRSPRVVLSGISVDLPVDAFLQASAEAEAALVGEMLGGIGDAERVVDLHAGLGTFTFALAAQAAVHAVEGSGTAVAALASAAARAGLAQVSTDCRDLEERPLLNDELARFDAVVLDPPRVGAKAQCSALAGSAIRRVVAVSCNPASFARDARLLVDGGFRLTHLRPIDQFVWSPHVELVAYFDRVRVPIGRPQGSRD
jgi:23S rRNA (uracil1939-C5)-methyltransferase